MSACEECGFDGEAVPVEAVPIGIRSLGPAYRAASVGADEQVVRERPAPDIWSVHEYASHVRDVLLVQRDRVVLARVEDRPVFARMHREERIAYCAYGTFSFEAVLAQLEAATVLCAATFGAIEGDAEWGRRFVYSWPEPAEHDLRWLGRHTLHEGLHHLFDVRRMLGRQG